MDLKKLREEMLSTTTTQERVEQMEKTLAMLDDFGKKNFPVGLGH
ncbi:hypothetical protein [Paenibacillus sp. UASWS1643]|nr:hypothetical protein [Paenibacillus sp. UASWS1643]